MKKMPLISIVIPVYNVEKFIKKCINSVINQEYINLEIILVDDGSTDSSGSICDKYLKKDKRIKVIHKKNGGLSSARNAGIDKAKGDYICFIDSDDYVEESYISKMYDGLIKNNIKICQCGINYVDENDKFISSIGYSDSSKLKGRDMLIEALNDHQIENTVAWNRLYKIELFKKLRFPNGKIHEDEFTTYKLIYDEEVYILKDCLYNYRQNSTSITRSSYNLKRLDSLLAFEEKLEFYKEKNDEELYYGTLKILLGLYHRSYVNVVKFLKNEKDIKKMIHSKYKEYLKKYKRKIKGKEFIKYYLFYYFPMIYYFLKRKV